VIHEATCPKAEDEDEVCSCKANKVFHAGLVRDQIEEALTGLTDEQVSIVFQMMGYIKITQDPPKKGTYMTRKQAAKVKPGTRLFHVTRKRQETVKQVVTEGSADMSYPLFVTKEDPDNQVSYLLFRHLTRTERHGHR